jgi:hypothetical protein
MNGIHKCPKGIAVGGEGSALPIATVIIPTWNGLAVLRPCLEALKNQTVKNYQIIVVDNGSTDGTVPWLKQHYPLDGLYPPVQLIENSRNLGFAAAVNQGIRASETPYVVTLNNDTQVDPGWLAALLDAVAIAPDIGMGASKMVLAHRPDIIDSTGICVDRVGIIWDRRGGEIDNGGEAQPVEVFGPCGGAALYRRAMLDQIGLFDEDFFAYMEDVDLAWRAQRAGWRAVYVPAAKVVHHHSATGREGSAFKGFHLGRNKVWTIVKNYPFLQLWYYVPLMILYDFLAFGYALLFQRNSHALRGRLAALGHAKSVWHKRRALSPQRTGTRCLSAITWPWQVPARYYKFIATDIADSKGSV